VGVDYYDQSGASAGRCSLTIHLGDVLEDARRRSFVGRRRELASFDEALQRRSPRRVLFVHGPCGIGKTSLLFEFRAGARAIGRTVVFLDGREVDPSPEGFHAVRTALGNGQQIDSLGSGAVLLIRVLSPVTRPVRQHASAPRVLRGRAGTGRFTASSTTTSSADCAPPDAPIASCWRSTSSTCTVRDR
jgi:AAA ATPase domain